MRYKLAQTKGYVPPSSKYLIHSAKGTTWSDHKYIKVEDGKYFYPDSYEGGRHAKEGEQTVNSREPTGWENKLFSTFENNLKGSDGMLDPKSVQWMLMFGKDDNGKPYDNFKMALSKAGIDTSQIDENSLNLMRYKVVEHYKKEFEQHKEDFNEEGYHKERTELGGSGVDKWKDSQKKPAAKKRSAKKSSSKETTTPKPSGGGSSAPIKKRRAVNQGSGKVYTPGVVKNTKKK